MAVPGSRSAQGRLGSLLNKESGSSKRPRIASDPVPSRNTFRPPLPPGPPPAPLHGSPGPPRPPPGPPPSNVARALPKVAPPATAIVDDGRPRRLFVGNLHLDVDEGTILKIFGKFGTVSECAFLWHFAGPHRGKPKGFCFVEMATHEQGEACINGLHGRRLKGRELRVNFARNEGEPPPDVAPAVQRNASQGPSSGGAPAVDDRVLERRALAVKMQLQRLGVAPKPASTHAPNAAVASLPTADAASAIPSEKSEALPPAPDEEDDVVAGILGGDS